MVQAGQAGTFTSAISGCPSEEFGHHALHVTAFCDRVTVPPMRACHVVCIIQCETGADCDRFLSDSCVTGTSNQTLGVQRGQSRVEGANQQHAPQHFEQKLGAAVL